MKIILLVINYFRRQNQTKESLVTEYFDKESNNLINAHDKKTFWDQSYFILQFKINNFMDFIQINNKN